MMDITQLWEMYNKRVFMRLLCLVHDWHTAEDLLQEVYLKAIRFPPKDTRNLASWLYQIATNVVRDYIRAREHRVTTISYDHDGNDLLEDISSTRDDPDRYYAKCDLQRIAFARISRKRQQEMIDYHILGKPATKRIGQIRDDLKDSYRRLEQRVEREMNS